MIIIDVETRADKKLLPIYLDNLKAPGNIKDPDKIKANLEAKKSEALSKLATDQDFSEIACIGVKIDDQKAKLVTLEEVLNLMRGTTVITFNGKTFDIPILFKNAIKKGLVFNAGTLLKKWKSDDHIDLMEIISCNSDYKSLDTYLQIYLGIKKTPIDFDTCTQKELETHCLEDCENTYLLYQLFKNLC